MKTKALSLGLLTAFIFIAILPIRAQLIISRDEGNIPFENYAYADFHVGWGTPHNTYVMGQESLISGESATVKNIYGSLGSGIRIGAETGYYFYNGFSGSIAFDAVIGSKTTVNYTDDYYFESGGSGQEEFQANHMLISIKGNYTWSLSESPFTVSVGAGPTIAIWGVKHCNDYYSSDEMEGQSTESLWEEKVKIKPGFGVTAHIAVMYDLSEQLSFGPTVSLNSIGLKYTSSELTDYHYKMWDAETGTVYYEETLDELELNQKNWQYVDEMSDDLEQSDEYSYQLNSRSSFSHIEWGIRLQYKFNRNTR